MHKLLYSNIYGLTDNKAVGIFLHQKTHIGYMKLRGV